MTVLIKILGDMQRLLSVPKNQLNKFGGYKYRSCEDILECVKKLLPDGVALILNDEIEMHGDRFYVKATATISNETDKIEVSAYAREPLDKKGSDASQITGAASSYARKYALNGLFCIDDSKDADATNSHQNEAPKYESQSLVKQKVIELQAYFPNDDIEAMSKAWKALSKETKEEVWKQLDKTVKEWIKEHNK